MAIARGLASSIGKQEIAGVKELPDWVISNTTYKYMFQGEELKQLEVIKSEQEKTNNPLGAELKQFYHDQHDHQ